MSYDPTLYYSDITVLLCSYERPKCLERCLRSIKEFFPAMKVMVLDDSRKYDCVNIATEIGYKPMRVNHNMGIGPKRNLLLEKCDTEFFFLMDDDNYFTKKTKINEPLRILKETDIDILGLKEIDHRVGDLTRGSHVLEIKGDKAHVYWDRMHSMEQNCQVVDSLSNCFIGKTDRVKEEGVNWDPELKCYEAWSFFFHAKDKLKLATYRGDSEVMHKKVDEEQCDYYKSVVPFGHDHYRKVMLDNLGITEIIKHGRKTTDKKVYRVS